MVKINYAQFLKESTNEFDDFIAKNKNARIVGKGFKRAELGVTVIAHDGNHLQFMREEPGFIRFQEWVPNQFNSGKILRGAPVVLPAADAFKLAGNRAIPEHKHIVPEFFRVQEAAGYGEYHRGLDSSKNQA